MKIFKEESGASTLPDHELIQVELDLLIERLSTRLIERLSTRRLMG
jgi:hypothetical protein